MASDAKSETRKIAVTTTSQSVDMGNPPVTKVYFHADTDNVVQVDFDQPCDASSFLLGTQPIEFDVAVNKIHVQTTTGTANLYILGIRK